MSKFIAVSDGDVQIAGNLNRETLTQDAWELLTNQQKLALKQAKNLVVPLADVANLDSAGLAWLLNLKRDASQSDVDISYTSIPESARLLATLSGVEHLFIN